MVVLTHPSKRIAQGIALLLLSAVLLWPAVALNLSGQVQPIINTYPDQRSLSPPLFLTHTGGASTHSLTMDTTEASRSDAAKFNKAIKATGTIDVADLTDALSISSIDPKLSAPFASSDAVVLTAVSVDGQVFAIDALWLKQSLADIDSDVQFKRFLAGEAFLYQAIDHSVSVIDQAGNPYEVSFKPKRLSHTTLIFWLHPLLGLVGIYLALFALKVGPLSRYHLINFTAAILFYISMILAVSALDRSWAIDPTTLLWRFNIGNLIMRLSLCCYLYLLWQVPYCIGTNFCSRHIPTLVLFIMISSWISQVFGVYSHFSLLMVDAVLLPSVLAAIAIFIQYRYAHHKGQNTAHLVNQIALRWLLIAISICAISALSYNLLWMTGITRSTHADLVNALVLLVFEIGIVTLLIRSELYRAQRWWWRLWGALVAVIIASLIFFFITKLWLNAGDSSWLIGLLLGVVAGLLSYWLLNRYFADNALLDDTQLLPQVAPRLIDVVAGSHDPKLAHSRWCQILQDIFEPIFIDPDFDGRIDHQATAPLIRSSVRPPPSSAPKPLASLNNQQPAAVCHHGESLHILGFNGRHILMRGAALGRRLFSHTDAARVTLFWRIASQAQAQQQAYRQGIHRERQHIAADLQDDIGGKLLSMIASGGDFGQYASDTLQDLNMLTQGLRHQGKTVAELFADIHYHFAQCCQSHGVNYNHDISVRSVGDVVLTAQSTTFVSALLNELLRNALQHSGVTCVELIITISELTHVNPINPSHYLKITVSNNGAPTTPQQWQRGLGITSIKRRINEVTGQVAWRANPEGGASCEIQIAIEDWLKL